MVSITLSANPVNIGEPVTIHVLASDNDRVIERTLTINGTLVTLDSNGFATFTPTSAGITSMSATATDPSGNVGTGTVRLRVLDPNDTTAPVVHIASPSTDATVTYLTDINGTVTDQNLDSWTLQYALVGTDEFHTFATGTSDVTNAFPGTFDPTLLQNNDYVVRLTGTDVNGNTASDEITVSLTGNAKMGNFHLEYTDLQIPLAGIPITISRIYDTLQAGQMGDFGFGWTLSIADANIHETVPVNPNGFFAQDPFKAGTKIYLTNPNGKREGFTFDPIEQVAINTPEGPASPPFGPLFHPHFRPDPGVFDTLEVEDTPLGKDTDGNFRLYGFGFNYNPDDYRLTTKDGTVYRYNQFDGLQSITDTNSTVLTFTKEGIVSSTGVSIQFARDAEGRITKIVDPAGKSLTYAYDAAGNLVSLTDQVANTSRYEYLASPAHYMSAAFDPLGNRSVGATYDANGRLTGMSDALGNTTNQQFDLAHFNETVLDPLGNPTVLTYDPRGNVVKTVDPLGHARTAAYDANDNQVAYTDPRGFTTFQAFDSRGNITSLTDALTRTWEFSYNSFNKPLTATDALGRLVQYIYDAQGNLVQLINAAGTSIFIQRDTDGRIAAYTDNNGNTTTFSYGTIRWIGSCKRSTPWTQPRPLVMMRREIAHPFVTRPPSRLCIVMRTPLTAVIHRRRFPCAS